MTTTILLVKYTGEATAHVVQCSDGDLQSRLSELKAKDRVECISVYPFSRHIRAKRVWETETPEKSSVTPMRKPGVQG